MNADIVPVITSLSHNPAAAAVMGLFLERGLPAVATPADCPALTSPNRRLSRSLP